MSKLSMGLSDRFKMRMGFAVIFMALAWLMVAEGRAQTTRALIHTAVRPLPEGERGAGGGLFIGVNEFEEGSSLNLRFATDDAVAQAHVFVEELGLLQPQQTVLLLSGLPSMPDNNLKLERLRARGVVVGSATRGSILAHLRTITRNVANEGLLVISIASHGFERDGAVYVLPRDGYRDMLVDTAVNLNTVQARMNASAAGKKLLLVDACRESVDARGSGAVFSTQFQKAFESAIGHAVLLSTGAGQLSYERSELGHGVFTYHLLRGLRGGLPGDADGLIRLGALSDYVARSVREWWIREHPGADPRGAQQPWFSGEIGARQIPLAMHMSGEDSRIANILTNAALRFPDLLQAHMVTSIQYALSEWPLHLRNELIAQLEPLESGNITLTRNFVEWWRANGPRLGAEQRAGAKPEPGSPWTVLLGSRAEMHMVWIPPGTFNMGNDRDELYIDSYESPVTEVTLTRGFWMGSHVVTNAQFRAFLSASNYTGSSSDFIRHHRESYYEAPPGDEFPVVFVSMSDTLAFCHWLNTIEAAAGRLPEGYRYYLPTEAQWEYAARAGTSGLFTNVASEGGLSRIAWHHGNSRMQLKPVGQKAPNDWGLYDVLGNVYEWTISQPLSYPGGAVKDWIGFATLDLDANSIRGGSYETSRSWLRVTLRSAESQYNTRPDLGFRVVLAPEIDLWSLMYGDEDDN